MAEIRPFKGLRYSAVAGPLNQLTAPPYDVISPDQRAAYIERNPHNIVHLTLPEGKSDDRSKFVKYARSSALLSQWRREGAFTPEAEPSFYRYSQKFRVGPQEWVRTSLLCLIHLEPFSKGVVLPHEHTFASHKEDRLRLLEATRTHLESIFGLFEDEDGSIYSKIVSAPAGTKVEAASDEIVQWIEPITDPSTIQELKAALVGKRIWIADGHHRYETALGFREALGERETVVPEDYILISLASMSDPGLILLPTHRVVPTLKDITMDRLIEKLEPEFSIERVHSSKIPQLLAEAETSRKSGFGVALGGGHALWLTPNNLDDLAKSLPNTESERLRKLDSTLLHKVIFERLLGLSPSTPIVFTRDAHEAIQLAEEGQGVAFLMAPPTIEDMKEIALSGERMPHKSTYYYPKIWSGFVAWALEDFTA
jgi:uncharacterized protein (DUF1015 family)